MKQPLVSCIVPVFNGERFLKEAIDSILEQNHRPLEIIVVDDGSTDGTAQMVAEYGDQVRYLWQPNGGPAVARNFGLRAAQGEFIAFLDADDIWHPEKLERQMARFHERPEIDVSITYLQNFWVPELHEEERRFQNHRMSKPIPGYCTPTLLSRRAMFEFVGHFDESLSHSHDTAWFMRVAENGGVVELLTDVLVHRRLHQTNRSRLKGSTSREEYLHMLKSSLDRRRLGKLSVSQAEAHKNASSTLDSMNV